MEALASGLPVILTNKVNIHEILEGARAALVCDDSEEAIAGALCRWSGLGVEELEAMRGRQLALWRERFSRERVGERLEGMFSKLAGYPQPCPAS